LIKKEKQINIEIKKKFIKKREIIFFKFILFLIYLFNLNLDVKKYF